MTEKDYYPHINWQDKLEAYKKGVVNALSSACHPDHLNNVRRHLDFLEKKWREEWQLKEKTK